MGCKGALALAHRIKKGQDVGYDPPASKAAALSYPLHCKEFVHCVVASAEFVRSRSASPCSLLLEVCDLLPASDTAVYRVTYFETDP